MKRLLLLSLFCMSGILSMQDELSVDEQSLDDVHRLALSVKRVALSQKTLMGYVTRLQESHHQLVQDHEQLKRDHARLLRVLVEQAEKEAQREARANQDD